MKRIIDSLGFLGFLLGISLLAWMPFWMIYGLSNLLAFLLHRIIRYRRSVVLGNLSRSFPDYSKKQVEALSRPFYRNFSDILLEGIKGMFLSREEILKRYHLLNPELLEPFFQNGQSVFLVFPHYGNWEWGVTSIPLQVPHRVVGVYKPLRQPSVGRFLDQRRSRFGLVLRPISATKATMLEVPKVPTAYLMMSDQNPSSGKRAQWMQFLHQPTACLHGADYWGRRLNTPIVYLDLKRVKRGYYEISLETLLAQPAQEPEGAVTLAFMRRCEQQIRANPAPWLWSHRRWKRKLEDHPGAQFIDERPQ